MPHPIFVVDAFADGPFTGNPAGVCLLDSPAEDAWMQRVASEMKHAETAFVSPREDGEFDLRWFTPTTEVDLCGHATLASAHTLWSTGNLSPDKTATFHTKSGTLTANKAGEEVRLDFPAEPPEESEPTPTLRLAIPTSPVWFGANRMDLFVQLESESAVRSLGPSINAIAMLSSRGVIVTAKSDDERFDYICRFFAPAAGVPEDDATGSAVCALGPFWSERLGKTELRGFQASKRGGLMGVNVRGDRVDIVGRAVTVLEGKLTC